MIGYPYSYDDKKSYNNIISCHQKESYKIKLVSKTIFNGVIYKTYKIKKKIHRYGISIKRKSLESLVIITVVLKSLFGDFQYVDVINQSLFQSPIELVKVEIQTDQKMLENLSVSDILKISGGDLDLSKITNPGVRARNKFFSRKPKTNIFADAFNYPHTSLSKHHYSNLANVNPHGNGRDGIFVNHKNPDFRNPGCSSGPKSITVLNQQQSNSEGIEKGTSIIETYDSYVGKLSDKSKNHLTSRHGHDFGVDDPLPTDPNQNPTIYQQIRTRINTINKNIFTETVKDILTNPDTEVYADVSVRGIQSRVYHDAPNHRIIAIHTEGKFESYIMKAQPISSPQLYILQNFNKLD